MFFEPRLSRPYPHDPFKAIVAPRPIGWISSISAAGVVNLAPYSFFNAVADNPPMVMFASGQIKDTIRNVEETGEFVVNLATRPLAEQMNETSRAHPSGIDEFEPSGLKAAPCRLVRPPRVAESPASLECRLTQIVPLADLDGEAAGRRMAIGEVVGIHIDEAFVKDGRFDIVAARAIARGGYWEYTEVNSVFSMRRPDIPE